ncbi:MAG: PocR ligand-binding domain-containing protein [Proteobacteria bacterium]|nr:PocR ligand-binding domain-containing protein [Pseudomonadota bacterium]
MENGLSYDELEQKIAELSKEIARLKDRTPLQSFENTPISSQTRCTEYIFEDLFDINEIQKIQDSFAKATGLTSIITRPDGTPITKPSNWSRLCSEIIRKTEIGLRNCMKSDAIIGRYNPQGPIVQPCLSGGLWDGGASITIGEKHIANWLIGQVRNEELDVETMVKYAEVIGADEKEFRLALDEITYMSKAQFQEVCNALFLIANQLSKIAFQNVEQQRFISELAEEEEKRKKLEKQLGHAQKLEAVGRLAGGVAHDFNNILSVINGYSELLLHELDKESPLRKKIENIHSAGLRASRLTQQLVAFSRKQIISPRPVHIGKELHEINKMLIRLLGEDIAVEIHPKEDLWLVKLDQSQLEQVVFNLAVNARDAMPSGGKLIFEVANVSLAGPFAEERYEVIAGDYVVIAVSDTGRGMSKEVQDRIFEPFYTTKGPNKGTGLGLAMVYGIVKQNDGYISVYSEEGHGSTFKLYFPKSAVQDENLASLLPENGTEILPQGKESILLVEDEDLVREMCVTILSQLGYTVLEATNGKDALQVSSRYHDSIVLLVTDVVMPEMSGPEIADAMRQKYPHLKVLFMSGYTENAIVHHGVLENHINFLQKPVTPNSLSVAVRKALDRND